MKRSMYTTLFGFAFLCCVNVFSMDTLIKESTYASPIQNPVTIEYYGGYFWIANLSSSKVYKLNSDMVLIDSIEQYRSQICGICFKDSKLWVAVDKPAEDILISINNLPYKIYGIDPMTKSITDSLLFQIEPTNLNGGLIYGLGVQNDTFLLSLSKGWSSGIYSVYSKTIPQLKNYLPLSGLTTIANEIWGIRRSDSDNERNGHYITSLTRGDSMMIEIEISGSDIAYDGTSIFVCLPEQSSIVKLVSTAVAVRDNQLKLKTHDSQPPSKSIFLCNKRMGRNVNSVVTIDGRTTESSKRYNGQFGNQVFIFYHNNGH
jgi:hypothetical protein